MTCVVGLIEKGEVWLGADDGAYGNNTQEVRAHPKVFAKAGMLIGCCGSLRIPQVIQYAFTPPAYGNRTDVMKYLVASWVPEFRAALLVAKAISDDHITDTLDDSGVMIGFKGRLFLIEDDLNVGELVQPFHAMGSGGDHAMGALHQQALLGDRRPPEERLLDALTISAAHISNVTGPFTIVSSRKEE